MSKEEFDSVAFGSAMLRGTASEREMKLLAEVGGLAAHCVSGLEAQDYANTAAKALCDGRTASPAALHQALGSIERGLVERLEWIRLAKAEMGKLDRTDWPPPRKVERWA